MNATTTVELKRQPRYLPTMVEKHFLDDGTFAHIVQHAPLVSIDIAIEDPDGHILVGLRMNEPAKGTYFVPGGIIRKDETIEAAFSRILAAETGCRASLAEARFLGVFQHFYETNRFGGSEYSTHYVVLGYRLRLGERPAVTLDSQHKEFRWMTPDEILSSPAVHANTRAYCLELNLEETGASVRAPSE